MTTLSETPVDARNTAAFGTADNPAAAISYDVPLPGSYSIRRVQPLDLPADHFTDTARTRGRSLAQTGVVATNGADGDVSLELSRLDTWLEHRMPVPLTRVGGPAGRITAPQPGTPVRPAFAVERPDAVRRAVAQASARTSLTGGRLRTLAPLRGLGTSVRLVPVETTADTTAVPTLALVETYQVSSFLGDYGLGRTIQTFSLLPGEQTTITIETWRSSSSNEEEASSVFESSDTSAQERFTHEVEKATETRTSDSGTWASSLSTSSGGGFDFFGLFGAKTQFDTYDAATSQHAREDFSRSLGRAGSEHASQVNNARQQSVQKTRTAEEGAVDSGKTVRTIANTNLRRVLNFVFRELNQTYSTVTSLRDVRLAFYNGREDSAQIVPLSGLRQLLEDVVVPQHREKVARAVLTAVTEHVDDDDTRHVMLQKGTREGGRFRWDDAELTDEGVLKLPDSPLERKYAWRFNSEPIDQEGVDNKVPGLVTDRRDVVLRTDNIVVEALLGQADALDPYATAVQALDLRSREADIAQRQAEARRLTAAIDLVQAQTSGQIEAWEKVLGDKPDISVVPAAAVADGAPR